MPNRPVLLELEAGMEYQGWQECALAQTGELGTGILIRY